MNEAEIYNWYVDQANKGLNQDTARMTAGVVQGHGTRVLTVVTRPDYEHGSFAYRWIDPDHKAAVEDQLDTSIEFVELDVLEDFVEKAEAIVANKTFDLRVQIPLDLDDELLLFLFKEAHKRDITFNTLMEDILRRAVEDVKRA